MGVDWCQSVLAAAEGSGGWGWIAMLRCICSGHAGLSLHQIFHPEKRANEQLSEIDATVATDQGAQPAGPGAS